MVTPISAALRYAAAGYPVIPVWQVNGATCACPDGKACKTAGKHPIQTGWTTQATTDAAKLRSIFKRYPQAHVGILPPDGHVILDIDPRNRGNETWLELMGHTRSFATPTQRSGGGGVHLVFKGEIPGKLGDGIDIKSPGRGFVVAWPSGHKSGGKYEWKKPFTLTPAPLPPQLRARPTSEAAEPAGRVKSKDVKAALALIPSDEYDRWIRYGQALKHDFGATGFRVWDKWSSKSEKYDADVCRERWKSFDRNSTATPVRCASIVADAKREFGYRPHPTEFDAPDADGERKLVVVDASRERLENITWLWQDRIPQGMLTLAAGEAGEGKSTVMAAIVGIVTRAGEWPDGTESEEPGRCIWLSVEDPLNSVLLPRAVAANVDRSKLSVIVGVRNSDGGESVFSLQDDLTLLRAELSKHPDTRLIVIDPITAYMHGKKRIDMNNASELRAILTPLARLAEEAQVAVICVTHLNKDDSRSFIHRVMGSQAWTAAARVVWAFGRVPDSPTREAVMIEAKRNVGKRVPAIRYRLEGTTVRDRGTKIDTSKVDWAGTDPDISIQDVFGGQRGPRATASIACKAWLRARLSDGPVSDTVLNAEAARASELFSESVYRKVRAEFCSYDARTRSYSWRTTPGDLVGQ